MFTPTFYLYLMVRYGKIKNNNKMSNEKYDEELKGVLECAKEGQHLRHIGWLFRTKEVCVAALVAFFYSFFVFRNTHLIIACGFAKED